MTLELADRSISCPVGVVEDVFIKVGTFHFLADFVVVEFDADPRVLLILRRSFLKTRRTLIDVYEGELTLRVGKKAVTFNLDQTLRYSANYDDVSVNRIDLTDVACKEYSQEVLGFFMSGNNSSPTLTSFGDSDFLLEETDAFLAFDDEPISSEIDDCYYDSEGGILLLEEFLNDDPSSPPLPPQELKVVKPTNEKFSIDEPPMVELKDLPPHLEYAILEGDDKLPVIIAKDLKDEEKTALIMVLKWHKQALAWQRYDIKACEEYVQEFLGFSDNSESGSPTLVLDPVIFSSCTSFTPFEGSDFILEEMETFLQIPDELCDLDDDYHDTEGGILYLKKLLNKDPSPNLPPVKTEDLKQVDATMTKPSIEEPPKLKHKELPSHLEYAFLEGTDKLPIIISKELKDEEKSALLEVLKLHKRAIA
nr:reverse transcriptase domain-containing protein [Tanacetum cinerariifolium]